MANGMLTISLQAHWQIEAQGSDGEGQCRARVCVCTRVYVKVFQGEDREVQCFVGCVVEPFKCTQKIGVFMQVRERD